MIPKEPSASAPISIGKSFPKQTFNTIAVVSACLVGMLGLSSCADDDDASNAPEVTTTGEVVVPGGPGEESERMPAQEFGPGDPDDEWNQVDVEFMTLMIHHHAQALEMADMVEVRSEHPQIAVLAERMELAQRAEISFMGDWLQEREQQVPRAVQESADGEVPTPEDHSHHDFPMAGMLTDEEMQEMRSASGEEFDRLFLEGMIKHHEGALEMAAGAEANGIDLTTLEFARHLGSDQSAEISRLKDLLDDL